MNIAAIIFAMSAAAASVGGYVLVWTPWIGCTLSFVGPIQDGRRPRTHAVAVLTMLYLAVRDALSEGPDPADERPVEPAPSRAVAPITAR